MTGIVDDEDFTPEQIASELSSLAELVRQGPTDPAELEELSARVEMFAKFLLRRPAMDPALAQRLQQVAAQLRTGPRERKNGSAA